MIVISGLSGRTSEIQNALIGIVGVEHFQTNPSTLDRMARTTSPEPGTRPSGVVRPANREQVQQIVKLVASHKLPIYPISTNRNWGYGDGCAPLAGCLILDLSRMNHILEVNTDLAYAVVEPGVTQGQLAKYLRDRNIPLMMDCTGAGPDAGIIGNTLDRGFGHSSYGDRFSHSCDYEAILPDGSLITSGFGSYPKAQAQHVYKHGVGPSLDGLLTQSNAAIVTRMTLWLMPKPEVVDYYFITLKNPDAIGGLVDAFRRLRLEGSVRSTVHCFNDRRLLASKIRYPFDQADGTEALEKQHPELFARLCQTHGVPAWAASGVLMGSRAVVAAERRSIKKALMGLPGLDRLIFINETQYRWLARGAQVLKRFLPQHPLLQSLAQVRLGMDMLSGTPSYDSLKGAHWRARKDAGPTQNALVSASGLIWISPVLPMTADSVQDITRLAEPIFHEFGFEYQVTFSLTTDRALSAVMSVCFDKTNAAESARAEACSLKLTDILVAAGYIPYRGSPAIIERVRASAPDYWQAVTKLKQAWDPENILAPGRYVPKPYPKDRP